MSSQTQIVRVKKLKGQNIISLAAKHNLRELKAGNGTYNNIDPLRSKNNIILLGPKNAGDVARKAKTYMSAEGILKLRKDAVRGIEVVISLPFGSQINLISFFRESLDWIHSHFRVPVVSAVIHNDQTFPHCHIILVPILNGRMNGSRLIGYKPQLSAMQENFNQMVGKKYGLDYQPVGKILKNLGKI